MIIKLIASMLIIKLITNINVSVKKTNIHVQFRKKNSIYSRIKKLYVKLESEDELNENMVKTVPISSCQTTSLFFEING